MSSNNSKGFTLVELLAAMGVLAILLTIITVTSLGNLRTNRAMQIRYEAVQVAQAVVDDLRFKDITTLGTAIHKTVAVGERTYTVDVKFCDITTFCISTDIRHISVDVTFNNEKVYQTDTVFTQFL